MMQVDRLLRLADFLESSVPASKFDMRHFLTRNGLPEELHAECGTSACAAGWAVGLWPDELRWRKLNPEGNWYPAYGEAHGGNAMVAFFGITYGQAGDLFGATPRTPSEEATLIRTLASEAVQNG